MIRDRGEGGEGGEGGGVCGDRSLQIVYYFSSVQKKSYGYLSSIQKHVGQSLYFLSCHFFRWCISKFRSCTVESRVLSSICFVFVLHFSLFVSPFFFCHITSISWLDYTFKKHSIPCFFPVPVLCREIPEVYTTVQYMEPVGGCWANQTTHNP